ncbi:MAG: calcium/sodium antiporter [Flavobacteriales bacterium]|nr:MAG: calcium/sodium antiporter [Flavobacteriales bacterium]|tara:strand:+ start:3960 stop:4895 length:936 start_codon:yes stop_codon:yes gene_type:complete
MNLALIFLGFFLLLIGGEFIVRSSVAISFKFNISKIVIGMTVVAFATSLPELIVSLNAAINGSPSIAINNVIGSNIANIGLVLALISILASIRVDSTFYNKDWPVMFTFSILLILFSINDYILTQIEGAILLFLLIVFIIYFLKKSSNKEINDDIDNKLSLASNTKIFIWLLLSSLSLYFGAEFLVDGAVNFAKQINISEAVISVSIVAIGTSIPELAASIIAIVKNEKGLSVGNLIGSNIFNIGSVLGITAIIKPIHIAQEIIDRDIIWMLFFAILLFVLALLPKRNKLSKFKGFIMLLSYFYFIFLVFM